MSAKEWEVKEVFNEEFDRFETVESGEQLFAVFDGLPMGFSMRPPPRLPRLRAVFELDLDDHLQHRSTQCSCRLLTISV